MIGSPWLLVAIGAAVASGTMVAMWLIQCRIGDASHVDVAWAYGVGGLAVLDAVLGDGSAGNRGLAAVVAATWSARLGTHILGNRALGKPEDGRYQELRRRWAPHEQRRFFVFFQAQALFVTVFSLPFAFVTVDEGPVATVAWIGAAAAITCVALEASADRQLAAWRRNPANRGPNYFFEWLRRVARRYQREVSVFVPLPPRRGSALAP